MQRMNPPRGMGPMGPGPQVSSYLSVHLYPRHLCAPAFSPFSIVCQSPHFWLSVERKGSFRSLAPLPVCGMLSRNQTPGSRLGSRSFQGE